MKKVLHTAPGLFVLVPSFRAGSTIIAGAGSSSSSQVSINMHVYVSLSAGQQALHRLPGQGQQQQQQYVSLSAGQQALQADGAQCQINALQVSSCMVEWCMQIPEAVGPGRCYFHACEEWRALHMDGNLDANSNSLAEAAASTRLDSSAMYSDCRSLWKGLQSYWQAKHVMVWIGCTAVLVLTFQPTCY